MSEAKQGKSTVDKNPGHRWGKGETGNRNGRPKDPLKQQFLAAIQEVEKSKKKRFLIHLVERAYSEDQVLIAVSKKVLPDLTEEVGEMRERFIVIRPAGDGK